MLEQYQKKMDEIEAWWKRENEKPCLNHVKRKPDIPINNINGNVFWPQENKNPDIDGLVNYWFSESEANEYYGVSLPSLPHLYGNRGTPMTASFYLGGKVVLGQDTVWVDPVIEKWEDFKIKFNENNYWWKQSIALLKKSLEKTNGKYFVWMPDLGDALTCFSLLRGTEKLLWDILENKEAIIQARDKFIDLWKKYHSECWNLYKDYCPGDMSWLTWAPGKTYACQCDFSTMLSPSLFTELVVPEIEKLGEYLDFIIWHLDGPEEIRHLEILLALPEIKAIQWVPGAGKPTAVNWIPMLKRIQEKNKALIVYASDEKERDILTNELQPNGLRICY
ncbi:MAG: hypothetical protein M1501_02430 [Candidatus Omnitrophica bacterium]|nr:hypothetical protein [Candidatus Omnitrophota bacterium]